MVCGMKCILKRYQADWLASMADRQASPQCSGVCFHKAVQPRAINSSVINPFMVHDLICPTNNSLATALLILALNPSTRQSQFFPIPSRHTHPTRYNNSAQGIRTLLLQIMSLTCSLYTIRPIRRTRELGFGGLEERELMLSRGLGRRI